MLHTWLGAGRARRLETTRATLRWHLALWWLTRGRLRHVTTLLRGRRVLLLWRLCIRQLRLRVLLLGCVLLLRFAVLVRGIGRFEPVISGAVRRGRLAIPGRRIGIRIVLFLLLRRGLLPLLGLRGRITSLRRACQGPARWRRLRGAARGHAGTDKTAWWPA